MSPQRVNVRPDQLAKRFELSGTKLECKRRRVGVVVVCSVLPVEGERGFETLAVLTTLSRP